jgi:hypothetical protein
MADKPSFRDILDQRDHYRFAPKPLANPLAQSLEVGIMVYHLATTHGNILSKVPVLQFDVTPMVDPTFF